MRVRSAACAVTLPGGGVTVEAGPYGFEPVDDVIRLGGWRTDGRPGPTTSLRRRLSPCWTVSLLSCPGSHRRRLFPPHQRRPAQRDDGEGGRRPPAPAGRSRRMRRPARRPGPSGWVTSGETNCPRKILGGQPAHRAAAAPAPARGGPSGSPCSSASARPGRSRRFTIRHQDERVALDLTTASPAPRPWRRSLKAKIARWLAIPHQVSEEQAHHRRDQGRRRQRDAGPRAAADAEVPAAGTAAAPAGGRTATMCSTPRGRRAGRAGPSAPVSSRGRAAARASALCRGARAGSKSRSAIAGQQREGEGVDSEWRAPVEARPGRRRRAGKTTPPNAMKRRLEAQEPVAVGAGEVVAGEGSRRSSLNTRRPRLPSRARLPRICADRLQHQPGGAARP